MQILFEDMKIFVVALLSNCTKHLALVQVWKRLHCVDDW